LEPEGDAGKHARQNEKISLTGSRSSMDKECGLRRDTGEEMNLTLAKGRIADGRVEEHPQILEGKIGNALPLAER
jgi:hypothetical protein